MEWGRIALASLYYGVCVWLVLYGAYRLVLLIVYLRTRRRRAHRRLREEAVVSDQVMILDGNTFVVSDDRGDIEASPTDPTGLFSFRDTRFLSKWVLTLNGQRLNPLSVHDLQYFETRFFLVPGTGTVYIDAKLSVIRERAVGGGFHEELTVMHHNDKAVDLEVRLEAACDFADLIEVKDVLPKKGVLSRKVDGGSLVLGYRRETYVRETHIRGDGAVLDASGVLALLLERVLDLEQVGEVAGRLEAHLEVTASKTL